MVLPRYGMIVSDPEIPWSVAVMVTDTAETPVTTPDDDTVAAAPLEVDHVAEPVTSCAVPSDIVAVAVNCDVAPTAGADPVTLIDVTVVDAEVVEVHASAHTNNPSTTANVANAANR
jgi:hypothetical protein